jgi:hypothetical protein
LCFRSKEKEGCCEKSGEEGKREKAQRLERRYSETDIKKECCI